MTKYKILTQDYLYYHYWQLKLSIEQIAKLAGCSTSPIYHMMNVYNIPRRSLSEATKGLRKGTTCSDSHKNNIKKGLLKYYKTHPPVTGMKGKKHTENTKRIMGLKATGEGNPMWGKKGSQAGHWLGGISHPRNTDKYKGWRLSVYERDKYTCQKCGQIGGHNLHAHHIKSFAKFKELRFDVANGLTLCQSCHKKEHEEKVYIPQPEMFDEAVCW